MTSHFARCTYSDVSHCRRLSRDLTLCAERFVGRCRERFLASRALLAELMWHVYGYPTLTPLIISGSGRPCFADSQLPDFSFACAGNMVGAMLAGENCRVGLDMEIINAYGRQPLEHQIRRFSSGERAWINAQQDPVEAATQIRALRLHPASGRLRSVALPDIQAICDVEPVMVWACALSPACERLQLWQFARQRGWNELHGMCVHQQNPGPGTLRLTSLPARRVLHCQ